VGGAKRGQVRDRQGSRVTANRVVQRSTTSSSGSAALMSAAARETITTIRTSRVTKWWGAVATLVLTALGSAPRRVGGGASAWQ